MITVENNYFYATAVLVCAACSCFDTACLTRTPSGTSTQDTAQKILADPQGAIGSAINTSGYTASVSGVAYKQGTGFDGYSVIRPASMPVLKNDIALGPKLVSQQSGVSPTYRGNVVLKHPSGQELFPKHAVLAGEFNRVFRSINLLTRKNEVHGKDNKTVTAQVNDFIPIFRKVQFMVLNDLYLYLTGVYELFNLTHFASKKAKSCTDKPGKEEVGVYLLAEQKKAVNKKALVLSHLINVIQGQMFFICSYNTPLIPKSTAVKAGSMLLENDKSIDINVLLRDFKSEYQILKPDSRTPELRAAYNNSIKTQKKYLDTLKDVLVFFGTYAGMLKAEPADFIAVAEGIEKRMAADQFQVSAQRIAASADSREEKIKKLRELKKTHKPINPPFFYYNKEMLRALKIIPQVAADIERQLGKEPKDDAVVNWPEQLKLKAEQACKAYSCADSLDTECADKNYKDYPVAFFTDNDNAVVKIKGSAQKLFINVPMPTGMPYIQEIKKQPDWVNSKDGILKILGACLGDYASLIGTGILNPCTQRILLKALHRETQDLTGICTEEIDRISKIQSAYTDSLVKNVKEKAASTQTAGGSGAGASQDTKTGAT